MGWFICLGIVGVSFVACLAIVDLFGKAWALMQGKRESVWLFHGRAKGALLCGICLAAFLGVFMLALLGIVLWTVHSNNKPLEAPQGITCDDDRDAATAWSKAENVVKGSLKAPATAKFGPYQPQRVLKEECRYVVINHVDAQNSFGALIRSHYSVTLDKDKETGKWTASELVM